MASVDVLMNEVFVRRMGGELLSAAVATEVQDWMYSLRPQAPKRLADDPANEAVSSAV